MGGSVRIAVRTDGEVVCREATTGFIRELIQRPGFLAGAWYAHHDGWEALPRSGLSPMEYGLVVIDRDTRWVGNHQGFCDPQVFPVDALAMDPGSRTQRIRVVQPSGDPADTPRERFLAAWRTGALTDVVLTRLVGSTDVQTQVPWALFARRRR